MRKNQAYLDWVKVVTKAFSNLSKPESVVLAMWTFGMVMTGSCGLTTVTVFLATLMGQKENTVRQRLREWYKNAESKKGKKRRELDVTTCFGPLVTWLLSMWTSDEKRLALAMDASTLGDRFTILMISVVYKGCGIPVAWKIVEATKKGSWKPLWLKLFEHLEKVIPSNWFVVVSADRGLYAPWLYDSIQLRGWHPFLRLNDQGHFCVRGETNFQPLNTLITRVGESWSGSVRCFKSNPIDCTLLARWDADYAEPWLIATDLKPEQANICWYTMRSWIECLFKDAKRGGWQWHQTKMIDPLRAERHWLCIAVATLWLVSVGGQSNPNLPSSSLPDMSVDDSHNTVPSSPTVRSLSCFRRGFITIIANLLNNFKIPFGLFSPEPDYLTLPFSLSSA